jgi:hypothetical protein
MGMAGSLTLQEMVDKYIRAAHSENTHDSYGTGVRRYARFGREKDRPNLFPASDKILCEFAAYLAEEDLAFRTIKGYLFGVRHAQLEMGLGFPQMEGRYTLQMVLRGIRHTVGDVRKPKMPITLQLLRRFAQEVRKRRKEDLPSKRVLWGARWAAILVGFFAMLRKDNITKGKKGALNERQGLQRNDVRFTEATRSRPAIMWLRLRYSKTNQAWEAPLIVPVAATGDDLCPVNGVKNHLAETTGGPKDNLFLTRRVDKPGAKQTPLPHTGFVTGIKTLAGAAGVDPKKYAGHSLRRGGATLAFQLGIRSHLIQGQGGWKGDSVFLYNELSAADRLELPTLMARAATVV